MIDLPSRGDGNGQKIAQKQQLVLGHQTSEPHGFSECDVGELRGHGFGFQRGVGIGPGFGWRGVSE
ncbi:hypothetical protein D2T31_15680 [Sinirhodobacter populi]|uniref:Uncharacterized protein n=1 Tax=Paenirhodobacter populi TaxID=2306993 RepID=A0A443K4J2_9RHOB|nr:hypothetical protein [Sinirhodobacter populi]RWR27674.1 hypothetical protein D2T31_15680 [Sinirhodobacter populi]